MEQLGRGVVAIRYEQTKVFIGWRLLGTDPDAIAFNLYRTVAKEPEQKLNSSPFVGATSFVDETADLTKSNSYFVRPVLNRREQPPSASFTLPANAPVRQYLSVPLQTPDGYSPRPAISLVRLKQYANK
jgi:rhamnogalacturonan endolyase